MRLTATSIAIAMFTAVSLPAAAAQSCSPHHHVVHHHVVHHHVVHRHVVHEAAPLAPCNNDTALGLPETTGTGYDRMPPGSEAYKNITGHNGSPCYRAADEQRSYALHCGVVYHRFFDEHGSYVDRGVRVCN